MTTKSSASSSQKSMVVSINGGFELQDEDDYTAKRQTKFQDDNKKTPSGVTKVTYTPTPPTEAKKQQASLKPSAPPRPHSSTTRPKSSDSSKRTDRSNHGTSQSWLDNKDKSTMNNQKRPTRYDTNIYLYL
jgi:hypothetical protein